MKYSIKFTSQFKRDLKAAKRQGKDIEKLAMGEALSEQYREHHLGGKYIGCLEPDWLMIYEFFNEILLLELQRLDSHGQLFQ